MLRTLLVLSTLTISLNCFRLLQTQELTTQAFANNFENEKLTQVEANIRSDTEESHAAGYTMGSEASNSKTLIHGQLKDGDALAGTETTTSGKGTGLSQTQNETFSREVPNASGVMDELKNFLDSFGEDKYIRSINGVATDGANTKAGAIQKMFNEEDSTRKASGADGTADYGAGVAGQLSATRYNGKDATVRDDVSATGENLRVAVRENLWLEDGDIKNAGAGFADSGGPNNAAASSGSGALDGDGVLSGVSTADAEGDKAKARSYVVANPPRDQ
jgi:hypothetical protein